MGDFRFRRQERWILQSHFSEACESAGCFFSVLAWQSADFLAGLCYGQRTDAKNESRPDASDNALAPLAGGPSLAARKEEMLGLINGLHERVARLEARDDSDGDLQPATGDYAGS